MSEDDRNGWTPHNVLYLIFWIVILILIFGHDIVKAFR